MQNKSLNNNFSLLGNAERICSQQLQVRHARVGLRDVWHRKAFVELERLLAAHPEDEHRSLVEGEVVLVAGVELSPECNFVLVAAGDGDAVLLSIDYHFSTVVA